MGISLLYSFEKERAFNPKLLNECTDNFYSHAVRPSSTCTSSSPYVRNVPTATDAGVDTRAEDDSIGFDVGCCDCGDVAWFCNSVRLPVLQAGFNTCVHRRYHHRHLAAFFTYKFQTSCRNSVPGSAFLIL